MSGKRDLDYYMANPDQIPGDLGDIEAMLNGGQAGGDEVTNQDENGATSGAGTKTQVEDQAAADAAKAAAEAEANKQSEQQVLKSRDGKHEIPYSVLVAEREGRKQAERAAQQLNEQLATLQAQAAGKAAPQTQTDPKDDLTDAELQQVAEDFPAVGKLLKSLTGQIGKLNEQLGEVRQSENIRRGSEADRASNTVQEAIDASPELSYWQATSPEMFNAATQFDNLIKADPRNKGLSLDERFAKVVKAVEAVHGETELPAEYQRNAAAPAPSPAPAPAPAAKPMSAEAKKLQEARDLIAAAEKKGPKIGSLSDIPGGVPPESDELTQLGQLSSTDLGNKLMSMKSEDVMKLLARAA